MKLFEELEISLEKTELISIVGGGGKTTSMFKLGKELLACGKRVLLTTTTAIFKPEDSLYEKLFLLEDNVNIKDIKSSEKGLTVLSRAINSSNKLLGVDKEVIDDIFKSKIFDYIIVEADGSKRKPIKAPAKHEPVIPRLTTKTVGIIGLDCVGKKLYEENVHRAQILAKLTNTKLGDLIEEDVIYGLLVSSEGIFKGVPEKSQKYIILNKAENKRRLEIARKIKSKLKSNKIAVDKVIVGSMRCR